MYLDKLCVNPLGASYSCDGWISEVCAACPLQPIYMTSTNHKAHFTSDIPSIPHFTQDSEVGIDILYTNIFKLTIMDSHIATMALRVLIQSCSCLWCHDGWMSSVWFACP